MKVFRRHEGILLKKHITLYLLRSARRLSHLVPGRWSRRVREFGKVALNYRGARQYGLRGARFAIAARHSPLLLAPFGQGRLIVDSSDQEIGRAVYINGSYERVYMEVALEYLQRHYGFSSADKVFVDIGANIGTSTVDALLHFGFARAICFEPDPHNFTLLRMNLLLNGLEGRATAMRRALSDEDGSSALQASPDNSGDHRLIRHDQQDPGDDQHQTVLCSRLDTYVSGGAVDVERIGLIWVDTQGYEAFVLKGASKTLAPNIPVVIEYCPAALEETDSLDALEKLIGLSYKTVVDLRLLSHGLESQAVMAGGEVNMLRSRYRAEELTDLLLIK